MGIGANTAIFSLLHQVVLSSLPVEKPPELVLVTSPGDFKSGRGSSNNSGGQDFIFSYPFFRDLEKQAQSVSGLAAFRDLGANHRGCGGLSAGAPGIPREPADRALHYE